MEEKLPIRNQNTYKAIRCKKQKNISYLCFQIYYLLKQNLKFDLRIFLISNFVPNTVNLTSKSTQG